MIGSFHYFYLQRYVFKHFDKKSLISDNFNKLENNSDCQWLRAINRCQNEGGLYRCISNKDSIQDKHQRIILKKARYLG